MAFIDKSDEPVLIRTKDGIKPIKVTKKEYDKDMGGYIIREYEEVKKADETFTH